MNPNRLDHYLEADGPLQPLTMRARNLHALTTQCATLLPPELTQSLVSAELRDARLVLTAGNAAAAAKLRMLGGSLRDRLARTGAEVSSVLVRVQPSWRRAPPTPPREPHHLSAGALDALRELRQRLGDSPAGAALARLLAHHQPTA